MNQTFRVGVIRVITLPDQAQAEIHGRLMEQYVPALKTFTVCIPDQPEGIHSLELKAQAVPKIIKAARAFEDADAVVVSCADDPAVEELREELDIPVIGAGSSVAAMAGRYGAHPGILGITDYAPEPYARIFGDRLINLGTPEGVNGTLDLMTDKGRESVIRKALELRAAGASSIALSCTGMSTIGISDLLMRTCGIPVIDPVLAESVCTYFECLRTKK